MASQGESTSRPRFIGGSGGSRPTGEKAKDRRGTLRRLSDYLKPYHGRLALVAVLVVIATLLGLAGPALLGTAIDRYVLHNDCRRACRSRPGDAHRLFGAGGHQRDPWRHHDPRRATFCRGYPRGALPAFSGALDGLSRPPPGRRFDEPHFQRQRDDQPDPLERADSIHDQYLVAGRDHGGDAAAEFAAGDWHADHLANHALDHGADH